MKRGKGGKIVSHGRPNGARKFLDGVEKGHVQLTEFTRKDRVERTKMKVTDKKFLNIHHTIGPMMTTYGGGGGHGAAGAAGGAGAVTTADGLAAKAADKLLVSSSLETCHTNSGHSGRSKAEQRSFLPCMVVTKLVLEFRTESCCIPTLLLASYLDVCCVLHHAIG